MQHMKQRLHKKALLDLALIGLANSILFIAMGDADLFESLYEFTREHEELELDEIIPLFASLTLSFAYFSFRRWIDARTLTHMAEHIARIDELTQLNNRRAQNEILNHELERFQRSNLPFSVILLDIDDFKQINDSFGHQTGDAVLKAIADVLQQNTRKVDHCCRWGGEEFLICCPMVTSEQCQHLGEKLRLKIQGLQLVTHVSASFGIAQIAADMSIDRLIFQADNALYQAKTSGKNQVKCAPLIEFSASI